MVTELPGNHSNRTGCHGIIVSFTTIPPNVKRVKRRTAMHNNIINRKEIKGSLGALGQSYQ